MLMCRRKSSSRRSKCSRWNCCRSLKWSSDWDVAALWPLDRHRPTALALRQRIRQFHRLRLDLVQVEDKHLVVTSREPWCGAIQAPLRPDIPVASEIVPVDPDDALGPVAHVEPGVADFIQQQACLEKQ